MIIINCSFCGIVVPAGHGSLVGAPACEGCIEKSAARHAERQAEISRQDLILAAEGIANGGPRWLVVEGAEEKEFWDWNSMVEFCRWECDKVPAVFDQHEECWVPEEILREEVGG